MKIKLAVVGEPKEKPDLYLRCSWCGRAITENGTVIWMQDKFGRVHDVRLVHAHCETLFYASLTLEVEAPSSEAQEAEDYMYAKDIPAEKLRW